MRKKLLSKVLLLLTLVFAGAASAWAQKITTVEGIEDGGHYFIGCTVSETDYYLSVNPDASAKGTKKETTADATEFIFTAATEGGWYIQIASNGKYITLPSNKDNAKVNVQDEAAAWTATNVSSLIQLKINGFCLQGNSTTSLNFGSYASGQKDVWLLPASATPVAKVAKPTFSPTAGAVEAGTEVTISSTTEGATVYYTTDGSEPSTSSTEGDKVTVTEAMTIKAIAAKDGMENSAVAIAAYTIKVDEPVEVDDSDLKLDFTKNWDPSGDNSFTSGNYTITGEGATFKFNGGYFIFGKNGAYVNLPVVDFPVEKIEVVGRSGASASVVHNIYVGETAVSEAVTGLNGTTSTFEIDAAYQEANTQYVLKVTSDHNAQVTYIKYYKRNGEAPVVTVATTVTIDDTNLTNKDLYTNTAAGSLSATVKAGEETVEDAVVAWESSNTDVATVSQDGTVTLVAAGTTTITASYAGKEGEYKASKATYELVVTNNDPTVPGTKDNPYTVAEAIAYINTLGSSSSANEVYVKGIISQVDGYNSKYGSITYWISDDGTTATQMQAYSGLGLNSEKFSSVSDLNVGDKVVVCGTVKMHEATTPEFNYNNYLVSYEPTTVVVVPDTYESIAALIVAAPSKAYLKLTNAQVYYVSGKYMYVGDGEAALCFYNTGLEYTAGQRLNGTALVTYTLYKGTPQISSVSENEYVVTDGEPTSVVMNIADVDDSKLCILVEVKGTVEENEGTKYLADETGAKVKLYDNFKNGSLDNVEMGDEVVVKGIVIIYDDEVEIAPVSLSVSEGSVNVEITAAGWATYVPSVDVNFNASGVTAYTAKVNGAYVDLTEVNAVPAGTPVVLKGDEGTHELTKTSGVAAVEGNELKASDATAVVAGDGTIYALGKVNGVVGFNKVANGVQVPEGKAYLQISGAGVRDFLAFTFGETDGIQSLRETTGDGVVYNLAGQRVQKAQRGIYVKNGRKVVVK